VTRERRIPAHGAAGWRVVDPQGEGGTRLDSGGFEEEVEVAAHAVAVAVAGGVVADAQVGSHTPSVS
jgi:hypothetical protein